MLVEHQSICFHRPRSKRRDPLGLRKKEKKKKKKNNNNNNNKRGETRKQVMINNHDYTCATNYQHPFYTFHYNAHTLR